MEFIVASKHDPNIGLKIFFVRHAESMTNITNEDRIPKSLNLSDPPLSIRGNSQATKLATYIKQSGLNQGLCKSKLYIVRCSAMQRSLLTSQILQQELGIDPEVWVDLHEVKGCRDSNNNTFPGLNRSQIQEQFPGFIVNDDVTELGWFFKETPETEEEGWERASRVWERLKSMADEERYQGKSMIIVTHGLFLDFLIGNLCGRMMKGGNSYKEPRFFFFNTGISLVWIRERKSIIYYLDRVEHLVALL